MGIILSKTPNASEPAEFSRLLPAVYRSELSKADREVTVTMVLAIKDLDVMRAVHRLEKETVNLAGANGIHEITAVAAFIGQLLECLGLDNRRKLRILIVREMARRSIEVEFSNVRSVDLEIALFNFL